MQLTYIYIHMYNIPDVMDIFDGYCYVVCYYYSIAFTIIIIIIVTMFLLILTFIIVS